MKKELVGGIATFVMFAALGASDVGNLAVMGSAEFTIGPDATTIKDDGLYQVSDINCFDRISCTQNDGNDTGYEIGFATPFAKGIPFGRFSATGLLPQDMKLYQTDRAEYFPRLSAWHQEHENIRTRDTPLQMAEFLMRANPDPLGAINLHTDEDDDQRFAAMMEVSRNLNKPTFIGEFGGPSEIPENIAKSVAVSRKQRIPQIGKPTCGIFMKKVEARGVEPLSETPSSLASTRLA